MIAPSSLTVCNEIAPELEKTATQCNDQWRQRLLPALLKVSVRWSCLTSSRANHGALSRPRRRSTRCEGSAQGGGGEGGLGRQLCSSTHNRTRRSRQVALRLVFLSKICDSWSWSSPPRMMLRILLHLPRDLLIVGP